MYTNIPHTYCQIASLPSVCCWTIVVERQAPVKMTYYIIIEVVRWRIKHSSSNKKNPFKSNTLKQICQ